MPRPLRVEFENAFYHVINRARNKDRIFNHEHGEEDYESNQFYSVFLKAIEKAHLKFGVVVHAYCLMGNHYHLLIQTPKANLSLVMHLINSEFCSKYNYFTEQDGSLFKGRYKSILVDSDNYLQHLNKYIHRNPVEAGIVKNARDYKWSSYQYYIKPKNKPDWLNTEKTLKMLGCVEDVVKYKHYISQDQNPYIEKFYSKQRLKSYLGNKDFLEKVLLQSIKKH
jgi:putative transposase